MPNKTAAVSPMQFLYKLNMGETKLQNRNETASITGLFRAVAR